MIPPAKNRNRISVCKFRAALSIAILFLEFQCLSIPVRGDTMAKSISTVAAMQCIQKMKEIEFFATQEKIDRVMSTRFTEEEINAYLSLDSNSGYQSCWKNMRMSFKDDLMEGIASVDFDCLKETSSAAFSAIILQLFSGIHVITARGTIVGGNGKGHIQLDQVRFDDSVLPKFLIQEVIASVCRKQDPPFNPMEPSQLPYNIKKITIHPGYIIVYQ